jgi:anti-sigma factor ChrR (cupin superfamily)
MPPVARADGMQLNADFGRRAVVHAAGMPWLASPVPGVERRMLDRIGGEVARATSIVRYAPDSRFSAHTHDGGEEFLVLDGVFQDEHGDYPVGSYVRNPPTSRHTPGSAAGCTILVKLWQFEPDDRTPVRVDSRRKAFNPVSGRPGVSALALFRDANENVRLERWAPGEHRLVDPGGIELLVLDGGFSEDGETFAPQSWLRLPNGATLRATVGESGCTVWIKTGHLARPPRLPTV